MAIFRSPSSRFEAALDGHHIMFLVTGDVVDMSEVPRGTSRSDTGIFLQDLV